ncbi:hypothetical protein A2276_04385 [candidate division WOR-1 bacterium RIFOXYA12_FULL_43_27]|uniref:Uncharacterized protein n=1 Tax=candidate division WOR-1 bacterium RIFOXYC2_FULL_46_14 TaxID=1802587 RepID=A0A1F4U5Y3_UNCSA|nr:MAG: hypothetical protein A2276_04385 [candidate division WOR-1 bacterium RIFOXYA12_FULL_43_27]OGC18933.1 MAG: hypothetical protein A2292_08450 [candidate division WOR-1 bacterium RIFOXYB2_FULL_46_45]OGC29074.1 MAG: hypothetical protein A2232_03515 [candidate division WOR-1 bacterium RIFOXYA2_FULL_46_56]OGC39693.1 MAG: hypothetical protein A2438_06905 [candidate division WOR-1 bacterium RIFOXYC2_FULL_46_14]
MLINFINQPPLNIYPTDFQGISLYLQLNYLILNNKNLVTAKTAMPKPARSAMGKLKINLICYYLYFWHNIHLF